MSTISENIQSILSRNKNWTTAYENIIADSEAREVYLESLTKAKIKELGESINVSLNTSSTKATMISQLIATPEYVKSESERLSKLMLDELNGV